MEIVNIKKIIDLACESYCQCCDTKECEDLGVFSGEVKCDWVENFRKKLQKKMLHPEHPKETL